MNKIAVLGNAGGGKTTLSLGIARSLGIPCFCVDKAQWRPRWEPVPLEEFNGLHDSWLAQPRWIIEGWGDVSMLPRRLDAADTVILIELPLWRHCWWALKRQCTGLVCSRSDTPAGCPLLSRSWRLLKALRWGHRHGMPLVKELLSKTEFHHRGKLHLLNSPKALDRFLAGVLAGAPPRAPG